MAVILHARLPLDEGHGEIAQLADGVGHQTGQDQIQVVRS